MTTKIWRGDSIEVAQVVHVTPVAAVAIGDIFALAINGKRISVTATAATAANVATLFAAAIAASSIPEWQEVTASVSGSNLVLTAGTAGIPFELQTDETLDALEPVSVVEVTDGVAGVNAIQTFKIPVSAAGTFTIVLGDQITSAIAVGASAATVLAAIEALSTIGASNVTVGKATDANDDTYTVEFVAGLAGTVMAELIVDLTSTKPLIRTIQNGSHTGTVQNEIQTVDCGDAPFNKTFTLTLAGQTTAAISPYDTVAVVAGILTALSNVVSVTVTKTDFVFMIEFTDVDGSADQASFTASVYSDATSQAHRRDVTVSQSGANAANEVQRVSLNGNPTGGTWTLTFGANTTTGLAYNISAAALETALEALASVGVGNVTVTGDDITNLTPYTVEFIGTLAAANQAMMFADGAGLTGATDATLTVTTITASSGPNHYDDPLNWSPVGVPVSGDDVRFEDAGADCLYGLAQSGVVLNSLTISMGWQNRKLGLPHLNAAGYLEYREQQLTVGATVITIGTYQGTGPSRVYLDTGTDPTAIELRNSGGSTDALPAVIWIGDDAANSVVILGGEFGTAPYADTTARLDRLTMYGGRCVLRNTTIETSLKANRNPLLAFDSTLGGKAIEV